MRDGIEFVLRSIFVARLCWLLEILRILQEKNSELNLDAEI